MFLKMVNDLVAGSAVFADFCGQVVTVCTVHPGCGREVLAHFASEKEIAARAKGEVFITAALVGFSARDNMPPLDNSLLPLPHDRYGIRGVVEFLCAFGEICVRLLTQVGY